MANLLSKQPFYINDVNALREKLSRAEWDENRMGQVWTALRRRAKVAPDKFPWFTPFVAMVTNDPADIETAKQAVRAYVNSFNSISFSMGVQFHFWCFAFPHARWSLYFQWLQSIGAWEPEEEKHLRDELLRFQFTNFFYGMRTKPEPMCVDNQTMSLCFSNALLGHLFGDCDNNPSAIAQRIKIDGARRLPSMLGGMPPSGYSGEGSTYMDHVVGPCIPFLVELLERIDGTDWYSRQLPPHGSSAEAIVRMISREWMPNGLTLPWDHYGYSLPTRSCIAYGAYRTGDPLFFELLEKHASWSHDVSIGWGYDDLIWTLIWWPEDKPVTEKSAFPSWAAPEVGSALVSDNSDLYLMQMWDETNPGYPTRAHVNPNALVLSAFGSPLTTDGVITKDCTAFNYDDTWRELTNMTFTTVKTNFGTGCAGSHGVLIIDNWEGMRAEKRYDPQATMISFDENAKNVIADVTPLYKEHWPDTQMIRRKSGLYGERFWIIEDLAVFDEEHDITARWYFRPDQVNSYNGVTIETAEGIRLHLIPLYGPDEKTIKVIDGYPDRLDGKSVQVNFHQRSKEGRWLWLAWPENTRREAADLSTNWQVIAESSPLEFSQANQLLQKSTLSLPFTMPAFMLAELPVARRWWYRKTISTPKSDKWWLQLPKLMINPRLWINGKEINLDSNILRSELLCPQVKMPDIEGKDIEIVVVCECGISQYGTDDRGGTGFSGKPAVIIPDENELLINAGYTNGKILITSTKNSWEFNYDLMNGRE